MGNSNVYDRRKLTYKYYNLEKKEKINLSYRNIKSIDYYIFNDLTSIKYINLSHNELELLSSIFHGLSNLVEIDLQYNQLKELDSKCFRGLANLECIKLQDNKLKSLHSDLFQGLRNLKSLFLNNNQIHELSSGLFSDCENLTNIRLQDNQLRSIDPYTFSGLKNLKLINICNNNWTTNWLELSLDDKIMKYVTIFFRNSKNNDIDNIVDPSIGLYNEKYKRECLVSSSELSTVCLVKNMFDNKKYIIKSIPNDIQTYTRECDFLKKLQQSPRVLKFYESFIKDNHYFIVTEFCEGGDLRKRIRRNREEKIELNRETLDIWSKELIEAIAFIHSKNIIHRDIKPENIFLTLNDNLKVGDFGASTYYEPEIELTMVGAPCYISPEMKGGIYNFKTDVWSAGLVIFEMITYVRLYEPEKSKNELSEISINETLDKLKIGNFFQMLLRNMLQVDPNKRKSSKELLGLFN